MRYSSGKGGHAREKLMRAARFLSALPQRCVGFLTKERLIEAARFLAQRTLLDQSLADDAARLANLYRRCTGRKLLAADQQVLLAGLGAFRSRYRSDPQEAEKLLAGSGEAPRDASLDASEHAAWMMIATTVLNLDATLVVD